MNPGHCICAELSAIRPSNQSAIAFKLALCLHVREKFKPSNTGKIFNIVYDSVLAIDSEPESMKQLETLIEENRNTCFVLFPSEDAVDTVEVAHLIKQRPLILVPDGTWKQAGRLVRNFPKEIPRVKINPKTLSRFLCRTQTTLDRVCTAEAVALLLEDMGLQIEADRVFQGLDIVQKGFNRQTFHQDERPLDQLKRRKPRATSK